MGYLIDVAVALLWAGLGYWFAWLRWQQYLPPSRKERQAARMRQLPTAHEVPYQWHRVERPERLRVPLASRFGGDDAAVK